MEARLNGGVYRDGQDASVGARTFRSRRPAASSIRPHGHRAHKRSGYGAYAPAPPHRPTSMQLPRGRWQASLTAPRAGLVGLKAEGRAGHWLGKNPGDVWRLATYGYRGAHLPPSPKRSSADPFSPPARKRSAPPAAGPGGGQYTRRRDGRPETPPVTAMSTTRPPAQS